MQLTQTKITPRILGNRWPLAVALGVMVAVLAAGSPASAQVEETDRGSGAQIVLTGRAEVRAGERVDTVVIFDGPAVIDGVVDGVVVALNGDIRVTGTVEEAVVAMNGTAFVDSGARVGGDVVSSSAPQVAPEATVEGETRTVRFSFRAFGILAWIAWWLAVTISLVVLGLLLLALAPRAMAAALATARGEAGPSIGVGLAVAIGLPVVSVLVLFSLVGIPLGLLGLLSLALVYSLGNVVAALALGRLMVKEPTSRYLAFLAGFVLLRLAGLIPFVGGLVTFLASAYGIGALVIAGWRAARTGPPVAAGSTVS